MGRDRLPSRSLGLITAPSASDGSGLPARRVAADILDSVLLKRRPFDEALEGERALAHLADRDRALVRMIASTTLRRLGTLRRLIGRFLERGLPESAPRVETTLLVGATQILFLDVPDHAAVNLAVQLVQEDQRARHYAKLVNAVLRRVAREGRRQIDALATYGLDTPDWLLERWRRAYGDEAARAIAAANQHEAPLDLTVKSDAADWAQRLDGRVVFARTVRTPRHGQVNALPGFADGAWWVQDAAASLPAHLLGDVRGMRVADLCAAPGGKAVQLAQAGARVTAVDRSETRMARVKENLARLSLSAELVVADATHWTAEPFDAVLLDPPCSSTGTIRRHPDVPWLKRESDIVALADLQRRLLDRAADLVKPGGRLVYCTCSLEPEEGEAQIRALLAREPRWRRLPVSETDVYGHAEFVNQDGDMRTLPSHLPDPDSRFSGLDGFYAARLIRLEN